MKSRPILFSAPMVRALLDGSKTQTRRVAKHPLAVAAKYIQPYQFQTEFDCIAWDGTSGIIHCPYGKPGDQLWVREAFRAEEGFDHIKPSLLEVAANGKTLALPFWHEANIPHTKGFFKFAPSGLRPGKYRPGMFMPRAASRITLEITGVRVERLQSISRGDAMAEGCPFPNMADGEDPRDWFAEVWKSTGGDWAANPGVWVIDFKRIEKQG